MKKIILLIAIFVTTITIAQNSLFNNISTTDQYTEYYSSQDKEGDGTYIIKERRFIVKFEKEFLPTGEGHKISAIVDEGKNKGLLVRSIDAVDKGSFCGGYPYESILTDDDNGSFVAIGDYVFILHRLKDDGTFKYLSKVFIKKGAVASKVKGKKKKKSFKERLLALKALRNGSVSYGPEHKALQKQNINKMIADYLVTMKAKQDARTPSELKSEGNLIKGKAKGVEDEKDEWAEAKRYNDSVKATPKWQDLQRKKEQNERNYQAAQQRTAVTLHNTSGITIYVGLSGSRNQGTKINAGGKAGWDCRQNAYSQTVSKSGGSTSYKSTSRKVYSANTGCGNSHNVN